MELQALLDEDDSQTQKQLPEQLSVSQQAVFNRLRLREMGKVQKTDRWITHELNDRQMEKRKKHVCDILLVRYKRKSSQGSTMLNYWADSMPTCRKNGPI